MEIFVIKVLSAAVCVFAAKLFSLKSRIDSVSRQLDDKDNILITTQLGGDELEAVVTRYCCSLVNDVLCELILADFPNFEAKSITPHFEDSGKPVYAHADRKMLTRVIQNLIYNHSCSFPGNWYDGRLAKKDPYAWCEALLLLK